MTRTTAFILKRHITAAETGRTACDYLAEHSALSRSAIKDAMNKGAVWLGRWNGRSRTRKRLRRATTELRDDDILELYYDPAVLALEPPAAALLAREARYSVWYKPPGLLAQGTLYGDHCSMLRQVEKGVGAAYLVHRLDREAGGLMLFAHDGAAAGRLSALFQGRSIGKRYRLQVVGDLAAVRGRRGLIDAPLDGRPALTEFQVLSYDPAHNLTTLEVRIGSGRLHQIRRHLDGIGFPLWGDPRYGRGNKNDDGLKLVAVELVFQCPFAGMERRYRLAEEHIGF
ncbi:MAG TPA: RluA family pseudouridine synthase [Candidatus Competibacteraceae bacterium]|nr:RluA family pseudouridine synthase [Candidatus Competibacteraceae bacterium]